ncbi:MAG: 2-C-methyl-D-erythritol 2,4-cyclodiphosphate synthase [Candidatus Omnitrophica bacterium]|nr:2-C-methyl-D-erythritol 2,4-cyclodiphosphate synthase [Candidatus Omnitrophota bacterium]
MSKSKIGLGFDVHRFDKNKRGLLLGGYKISRARSLLAVSDGDVVLHAVCDALCGAASLGDIGDYFPPDCPKSKGIKSLDILKFVLAKIKKYNLINIDITIIAEKPKLSIHKPKIVASLRRILKTKNVNVKVKSKEGLEILGGKDAVTCLAAVLIEKV